MTRSTYIPFGRWGPDYPRFSTESLAEAKNVMPVWRGYRLIRQIPDIEDDSGNGAPDMSGAYTHLISELRSEEGIRPNADGTNNGWAAVDEDGTDLALYEAINERQASTSDYIQALGAPSGVDCIIGFDDPIEAPDANLNANEVTFRMQYEIQGSDGSWTLNVKASDDGFSTTIFDDDITGSSDTNVAQYNYALDATEGDNVSWDDFQIKLTATVPGDGAAEFRPQYDADRDDGSDKGWEDDGGLTGLSNLISAIDNADSDSNGTKDGDYIISPKPEKGQSVSLKVPLVNQDGFDSWNENTWSMRCRAKRPSGSSDMSLTTAVYQGDSLISTHDHGTLTTSFADYNHNLTAGEAQSIEDQSDLYLLLTINRPSDAGNNTDKGHISFAQVQAPDTAGAKVSWMFTVLPLPGSNEVYAGDVEVIYAGKSNKLFQGNEDTRGFTDVSGVTYGTGTTRHTAWNFCSFGNSVIAANLSDPVQVLGEGDSTFSDLIDHLIDSNGDDVGPGGANTVTPPTAKFCATIGPHLHLANINYTNGAITGSSDSIWWSGYNDPETFAEFVDAESQANVLVLTQTPGQITGLVGGDSRGYAFKQRAIHALTYVGGQQVFTNQVVANDIGTLYPKSIVTIGRDIYFFSAAGFAVLRGGQSVELIGDDVNKFLLDQEYSDLAVDPATEFESKFRDNTIIGMYDQNTGLLIWLYRTVDTRTEKLYKSRGVIYNPFEDRWSRWQDDDAEIAQMVPRYTNDSPILTRGIQFIIKTGTYKAQARFEEIEHYAAQIKSHIISAKDIIGGPGRNLKITGVRLVCAQESEAIPPDSSVTVNAYEDPVLLTASETSTVTWHKANRDGWLPFNIGGEFFEFQFDLTGYKGDNIRLDGYELRYTYEGEETA